MPSECEGIVSRVRITRLRIDGQEFHLADDVDIAALQDRILDGAGGRPAFVLFRSVGHGEVSVLITAHVAVRFEVEEVSEEQLRQWDDAPPAIDDFPHLGEVAPSSLWER
jgi:hypothetical protein